MIIYVIGSHGVGKTTLGVKLGPDAEVCFQSPSEEGYEQIADIPWVTVRVREGQLVGVPLGASVVRVSADEMFSIAFDGLPPAQRAATMQSINDRLETKFDVVVHETFPQYLPREQDRIVTLSVPFAEIRRRQATQ